jgi:hypothetical protein
MSRENPGRISVEFIRAVFLSFKGSRTRRREHEFYSCSHYVAVTLRYFYFNREQGP